MGTEKNNYCADGVIVEISSKQRPEQENIHRPNNEKNNKNKKE